MKKYLIITIFLILLIPIGLIVNANAILVVEGTNIILAQTGLDEILASTKVRGYDGANFGDMVGGMFIKAGEAFTSSAQGIYIVFQTTPLNSITPVDVFKINPSGSIGINQTKLCLDSLDCSGNDYIISTSNGNNAIYSAGNEIRIPNSTGTLALVGAGSGFTNIVQLPPGTATILTSNSSNTAEVKSLTQGQGITITNGSTTLTLATNFKIDTTTCSNQFVSAFDNSTGDVTCTTATAEVLDVLAITTTTADTGETVWLAGANVPMPLNIHCGLEGDATPGNAVVKIQNEGAATTTIQKGSFYLKTP